MNKKFHGVTTAIITPFKNGAVDFEAIEKLVLFQKNNGVTGFVINGTTGESPTVQRQELKEIFSYIRNIVGAEFPLIVGTGSNSTDKTIDDSLFAEKIGADAVLVVVPYYNKPPQRGLFEHFTKIANSIKIPLILYNVPGRTITSLSLDTIVELSKNPNIIGIKEATGDIEFAEKIRREVPKDFILLSGDDGTFVDFMKIGGNGVISVTSHVFPKKMSQWYLSALKNEFENSQVENKNLLKLTNLLFSEANPIPVKKAAQFMGLISSAELRLPLVELDKKLAEDLKNEMLKMGILNG